MRDKDLKDILTHSLLLKTCDFEFVFSLKDLILDLNFPQGLDT